MKWCLWRTLIVLHVNSVARSSYLLVPVKRWAQVPDCYVSCDHQCLSDTHRFPHKQRRVASPVLLLSTHWEEAWLDSLCLFVLFIKNEFQSLGSLVDGPLTRKESFVPRHRHSANLRSVVFSLSGGVHHKVHYFCLWWWAEYLFSQLSKVLWKTDYWVKEGISISNVCFVITSFTLLLLLHPPICVRL